MSRISAGSYDLNKWLHGGFESDVVSVIYGPPGSGKTNFCLQMAVSQAKKGNKVIFVDTEGGFSSERVKQLSQGDYENVLSNIFLLKPTTFSEQKKAFEILLEKIKEQVSLIVIDSMTILYRLDFADARQKNVQELQNTNAELVRQVRMLTEIARKQNIPVLLTNQVYNWNEEKRMVGGDILSYWCKCIIELVNNGGKRTAFLRKHRSLGEKELDFIISDTGIKKRGWL